MTAQGYFSGCVWNMFRCSKRQPPAIFRSNQQEITQEPGQVARLFFPNNRSYAWKSSLEVSLSLGIQCMKFCALPIIWTVDLVFLTTSCRKTQKIKSFGMKTTIPKIFQDLDKANKIHNIALQGTLKS